MKQTVIMLFTGIVMASCGTGNNEVVSDTVTNDSLAMQAGVREMQAYRPNIEYTPWTGDLKDAIYWRDSRGENCVIVSGKPQYFWEQENPEAGKLLKADMDKETYSELTEIFAAHFVLKSGSATWEKKYEYHDYLFGCCDVFMEFQNGSMAVVDENSDGKGEVFFMYNSTEGDGVIGNVFTGSLVLLIDSTHVVTTGPTGLGNEENKTDSVKYGSCSDKLYSELLPEKWAELRAVKTQQDRDAITERNNVDESGHVDHRH